MMTLIIMFLSLVIGLAIGIAVGVILCINQEKRDGVYDIHNEIIRNKYGRDIDAKGK